MKKKELYYSPFNKIILNKEKKLLLFIGITGKIVEISPLLFFQYNSIKGKLLNAGVLLSKHPNYYLSRAKTLFLKNSNNFIPNIVIAPTMMCNFSCQYCFVRESLCNKYITNELIDKIIDFIKLHGSKYSIEWFGGEPSLSADKIIYFYERANSENLQSIKSLLITNGSFSEKNKIWTVIEKYISTIQITLDGTKELHDKRRNSSTLISSYEQILINLDALYEKIISGKIKNQLRVVIRYNVDRQNYNGYKSLREIILNRYKSQFEVQAAQVQKSGNKIYDKFVMSDKEYASFLLKLFYKYGIVEEPYLPIYRNESLHCRVNNPNSFVFDPMGNIYKCSLDIGLEKRIIGKLISINYSNAVTETDYLLSCSDYLPKKCKKCALIFHCWGGCPQKRMSNKMGAHCPYQKKLLNRFIEIEYKIQKANDFIQKYYNI